MTTINLTIAADAYNYDIYSQAGFPAGVVDVVVTINSGVVVGSHSATPAMYQSGSFAVGSTVTIINNGTIVGRGGNGGDGGAPFANGKVGKDGKTALRLGQNTTLTNNGNIYGGGGGGGGGAGTASGGGGGGGGGKGQDGGDRGIKGSSGATNGTNGTFTTLGSGGNGEFSAGDGGTGGGFNLNGDAGQDAGGHTGGAGGHAGSDIDLNGFSLVTNNTVTAPLGVLTLTGLTPTINVGGGMTAPLGVLTLTGLIPAFMGVIQKYVGGGGGWGVLSKPPFNEGVPDTIWNWFVKVWRWAHGETYPAVSQTADFNATDAYFYPVDATAGAVNVTLPKCTLSLGKKYVIKKTDASANTVTILADTSTPDLIDGAASKILTNQYDTIFIESDGVSNWWKLGATANATTLASAVTTKGDLWGFDTTDKRVPVGTDTWVLTADSAQALGVKWAAAAAGGSVTISTTAPGSPSAGDLWWKSDEGQLKIYFTDADSSQWVDAMNVNTGGTGVSGGGLTKIASVTTTGSQATITFSSIPATYTNLMLEVTGQDTSNAVSASNMYMLFNGDTTSGNYSLMQQHGAFATTGFSTQIASSANGCAIGYLPGNNLIATAVGSSVIYIPHYANTVFYKMVRSSTCEHRGTGNNQGTAQREFTWLSTAAINSITLTAGTTAFLDGSIATLYGLA